MILLDVMMFLFSCMHMHCKETAIFCGFDYFVKT